MRSSTRSKDLIISAIVLGTLAGITACGAQTSNSGCEQHLRQTEKEIVEGTNLLNRIASDPTLVLDPAVVEKAQRFNTVTAKRLNDIAAICGQSTDQAWTAANLGLLQQAQAAISKFNKTKATILNLSPRKE